MSSTIAVERANGVAEVVLTNPPLNLLTAQLRAELTGLAERMAGDDRVRAVVLRGDGAGFSAGSDVTEFPDNIEAGRERARGEHRCVRALEAMPQPVVVALHGHVLGGGLELALAGDLRVVEQSARIGLPEVGLGVFPSGGGATRLTRLVGPAKAKDLMFFGTTLDGPRAAGLGLADRVVADGAAATGARELAEDLAERPAMAVRAIKAVVNAGLDQPAEVGEAHEERWIADLFTTQDAHEGVRAFRGKRAPRFRHR